MKNEGTGCFLVTNSWGVGWGQGGHACVSEKWLKYHKRINPYVIIKGVKI
jgi:C1A family cysteine protease